MSDEYIEGETQPKLDDAFRHTTSSPRSFHLTTYYMMRSSPPGMPSLPIAAAAAKPSSRLRLQQRGRFPEPIPTSRLPAIPVIPSLQYLEHARAASRMPETPVPARAQTIKQAKAAYKTRGSPALSEREKKQLERSIELDRRAWRLREIEKKKAEAAKKRGEKERREREEQARARIGTQRRCDKFGYKSSQLHLGAFLSKSDTAQTTLLEAPPATTEDSGDDSFGDGGLDDDTLLSAVGSMQAATVQDTTISTHSPAVEARAYAQRLITTPAALAKPRAAAYEDVYSFFDELDSSTQIARELSTDHEQQRQPPQRKQSGANLSFSSGEFDLTIEDIEELEASAVASKKTDHDRKLMPPPPLPVKPPTSTVAVHELTKEELEFLVDDDIQLTQADPG